MTQAQRSAVAAYATSVRQLAAQHERNAALSTVINAFYGDDHAWIRAITLALPSISPLAGNGRLTP